MSAAGHTLSQAARMLGKTRRTVQTWVHDDPSAIVRPGKAGRGGDMLVEARAHSPSHRGSGDR
jgi:hypothetical protein